MHARYATHARTCFLTDFVSIENKGSEIYLPKLDVASSSLVARSISSKVILRRSFQKLDKRQNRPAKVPQILSPKLSASRAESGNGF